MILQVFAVYDVAAEMFGNPHFAVATGQALRAFVDEVNRSDKDNPLFHHSSDFDLYHLGAFDTSDGRFRLLERNERVLRGVDCRVKS